ncbi:MAG TPA: hypothetical protein VGL44_16730 [Gaiellales bacterium]
MTGLLVAAPPALAGTYWNSQMKTGAATASRTPGRCLIGTGTQAGSLHITCPFNQSATLTYAFKSKGAVIGHPIAFISGGRGSWCTATATATGSTVHVAVTVWGRADIDMVGVGYYSHAKPIHH